MTRHNVVELKHYRNWKQALGQVLVYSLAFPGREPMLHLFGEGAAWLLRCHIREACSRLGVLLVWDEEEL